jgi:hypothetical protein
MNPLTILKDAIRAVPAVRYALGVAGIAAVIAIIAGFQIDYKVAVLGVIIILFLMFILVIFAWFAEHSTDFRPLALFLAWVAVLLISATGICIFTGFFWGKPRPLGYYVGETPTPTPTPRPI